MSVNETEDALQRVNYFNGQRLAAADFRAEQGYHTGMRRVLNRSLHSPGIVVGLEVEPAKSNPPDPLDKHRVIVRRGLAFDHIGREILLPTDVAVQVTGTPRAAPGMVVGNLLVISYRETRQFPSDGQCMLGAPYRPCSGDVAWGAPTRIVADAVFEFLDSWPNDATGRIVLGQIELSEKCEVVRISPGVRRYAVAAKPQTVRGISVEGEKDIDKDNSKVLYFHVDGGYPESALLYLRGRRFPTLYYTTLGNHKHRVNLPTSTHQRDFGHSHQATAGSTSTDGQHTHTFIVDKDRDRGGIELDFTNGDLVAGTNPIQLAGSHNHSLVGLTLSTALGVVTHSHNVLGDSGETGATDLLASTGKPALTTFKDLVIFLDGQPVTDLICQQLEARPGEAGRWRMQVTPGDIRMNGVALSQIDGTGEIDLLRLGIEIGLGQHKLEFRVLDADVGGTLQYNLYVS
jgi:hypothetical protein